MNVDCFLDYPVIAAGRDEYLNLLVRARAPHAPQEADRPPLNLSLVLDISTSMSGEKLLRTKEAAKLVISRLSFSDTISIVVFADFAQTLVLPQPAALTEPLIEAVDGLEAGGRTNLSGGLLEGLEHLIDSRTDTSVNRLLLLTDGQANEGITKNDKLIEMARRGRQTEGVTTTTLGFGLGFNEDLLTEMARAARGNFYYIEQTEDAPEIFEEELREAQDLVAQNVSVTVRSLLNAGRVAQITDHPAIETENSVRIELGDASGGEEKSLLVSLFVPNLRTEGTAATLADVTVRYTEVGGDALKIQTVTHDVRALIVSAEEAREYKPRADVLREVALQQCAGARVEAIQSLDAGDFDKAGKKLRAAAGVLSGLPSELRSEAIDEEIDCLLEQAQLLNGLAPSEHNAFRKQLMTETMNLRTIKFGKLRAIRLRRSEKFKRLREQEKQDRFRRDNEPPDGNGESKQGECSSATEEPC